MTTYRPRNVTLEAIQWTGSNEMELRQFTDGGFEAIDEEDRDDDPEATGSLFETVHGTWVGLERGDWVVRGCTGLFFACSEAEFTETYEPVDADA